MDTAKPGNKYLVPAVVVVIVLVAGAAAGLYLSGNASSSISSSGASSSGGSSTVISIVAGENFWGSLASQLAGVHGHVTSVVNDPNTDPHEYASNTANAEAISNAKLVIVNGAGYDTWALDLLGAESSSTQASQTVINVQLLLNQALDVNPHFWYSPYYVNYTVAAMYKDLVKLDPSDRTYFTQQYSGLNQSLWSSYMKQETLIKQQFSGAPVAATEDIFAYMANATGLNLVSPSGFMQAVAEGNEPSAADIATFQSLLNGGNSTVHLLVYNAQTVSPLTQSMLTLASKNEIPYIRITETVQPPNFTFQAWMQGEVGELENGLNAVALGK